MRRTHSLGDTASCRPRLHERSAPGRPHHPDRAGPRERHGGGPQTTAWFYFDTAYKMKINGKDAYEVRGKDNRGKIREVEVSATGESSPSNSLS